MADSDTEITKEELQKEIAEILNTASLDKTSTKKVIQKLEQKLGVDLTEKKKLIDQLVMDYVNSMDSDEEESEVEEEPPKKKPAVRKAKKRNDDEDEEEHDDSNDSDWGYHHHHHHHGHHQDEHLLDGYSDENCRPSPQESTVTTTGMPNFRRLPKKSFILRRVTPVREDESDIFGKLTAKRLRKLSDRQRDSMMLEINKLFYEKCHKPADSPKVMKDKATTTLSAAQCDAKQIFRVNGMPTSLDTNMPPVTFPIAFSDLPKPFNAWAFIPNPVPKKEVSPSNIPKTEVPPSNMPKTEVPPSNMPEPVVQEAATPKPPNDKKTEYRCGLM